MSSSLSRGPADLPEEGSLGIVGRTGQLKRTAFSSARTPRKIPVQQKTEDWRRRPSQSHAVTMEGTGKAFAAVAQNTLSPQPTHVRTEPGGRLSLQRAGGVLELAVDLEGSAGSQSMRWGDQEQELRSEASEGCRDARQDPSASPTEFPASVGSSARGRRRRASEDIRSKALELQEDLQRRGFMRKSSLPGGAPSAASEVIRKSLNTTLRKFEAENDLKIGETSASGASVHLTSADRPRQGEAAKAHGEWAPEEEDMEERESIEKRHRQRGGPDLSQSSGSDATSLGPPGWDGSSLKPETAEAAADPAGVVCEAFQAEQDLLDLLPTTTEAAGGTADGGPACQGMSLQPQAQRRQRQEKRGVGLEATVETFDSGLQPQELPESATAAGIQDARPSVAASTALGRRKAAGSMVDADVDLRAASTTHRAPAVPSAMLGVGNSQEGEPPNGSETCGSGMEGLQTVPDLPDSGPGSAEPAVTEIASSLPSQGRRAERKGSKPLRRPSKETSEARKGNAEKDRHGSAEEGAGKTSARRRSRRHSKGAAAAAGFQGGRGLEAEGQQCDEPARYQRRTRKDEEDSDADSAVTDNDLSEFLQELFNQYSTSRDKKGRPLMSNTGLRRFLQDFTFGPGSRPSAAAQTSLAAQADVMYDEEIERQNNMPTVFDLTKGDANRGLCFKSFDIVVNQVNMPCSSREMTKRWFVTYSYGLANPTPADVAAAMYEGLH